MTLPACIFTYSGDAPALPWCVRGAILAGLVPVVCEDAADPLPAHTRGWLTRQGVALWTTTFPRRGNLNGTDCAAGICRTLARAGREHGEGHALKLDTDTVILRPGLFHSDPEAVMIALTCPTDRPGAYGMAYRLQANAADAIAAELEDGPLDEHAPEDLTIYRQARQIGPVVEREFQAASGPFSALPWDGDTADFARRFDVLTVGNPPADGWRNRAIQVAKRLKEFAK